MNLHKPLPQAWLDVLRKVQTLYPEAIIGGGALRDHYLGAPVKDVDIFVRHTGGDIDLLALVEATSMNWTPLSTEMHAYEANLSEIAAVLDGDTALCPHSDLCGMFCDCPTVQIIVCSPATPAAPLDFLWYQLARFDIGICKIAHNGRNVTYATEASFAIAERRLHIANMQPVNQRERSLARVERIAAKYPDWKIGPHAPVIPDA